MSAPKSLYHYSFDASRACLGNVKRYAFRVFGIYCIIFYVVPMILIIFFGNALETSIRPRPNYLLGFVFVFFCFFLFSLTLRLPILRLPILGKRLAQVAFDARLSFFYAVFFVAFALATRSTLGLSFRHSGGSLAEVGAIAIFMQFLKVFFAISILVQYRLVSDNINASLRSKTLFLIALGFFLSVQASLEMVYVLCALLGAGTKWRRFFVRKSRFRRWAVFTIIPFLALSVFFVGVANKLGIEQAWAIIWNIEEVYNIFSSRLSYHFTSTSMHVSESFVNFGLFLEAFSNVVGTSVYRMAVLLGIENFSKPEVVSIARMNFLQLTEYWRERTGTSPSILGSTFYLPGAGFAIFYYVFIIRGVAMMIGRIMAPHLDNILFILLSVVTLSGVLDAALDALNPLSPAFVRLLLLYLGVVYVTGKAGARTPKINGVR
jgi:hypothetical protein